MGRNGTGGKWNMVVALLLFLPAALPAQVTPVALDTLRVQAGSRASSRLPVLTRSIRVLTSEEIQALPVRTLSDLLEWAASVDVQARSSAQSDLSIRGAGFEQVVVLVDGVRMSDPQTGHFDLNLTVPMDQVERVEILRGPSSAVYGADAMGGVVNVITRGGREEWRGRAEGGSWGTARLSLAGGRTWLDGSHLHAGGEVQRSDGHRDGTDFDIGSLQLSLRKPALGGQLSGGLGAAQRDFGAQDFYAPYPSYEETRLLTSHVAWTGGGGQGVKTDVRASFRRHEDQFTLIRTEPEVYQNRHTSSQWGGEILTSRPLAGWLRVVVGGELFQDVLRSNSLGDREENRGALFSELVAGAGGQGVLSLGLRQDWHRGFGSFLSPSASASWRVSSVLRLRSSLGRSFRAPTWTERYYQDPVNVGREDLDPERAWSGEAGVDLMPARNVRFSLSGFYRNAKDLIDWAKPTGAGEDVPWETRNVEEADFTGLEVDIAAEGPWRTRITAGGMWLRVESEEGDGFSSKYALRPLVEKVTVGLAKATDSGLAMGMNLQRVRRRNEDPYHRLDLRSSVRLGPSKLYLDLTNALNTEYSDVTGALAPGRGLFLGLEVGSGGYEPRP